MQPAAARNIRHPLTVKYNGTLYYYVTNLQGDVTAILNTSGTAVVSYTYDAWGNILTTTGSMASTLGAINPLRYRGYVYDTETGLYYLQSRYYNPKTGRFLNADAFASTGQGLLGNNMFAYCNNNPVVYADFTGMAHVVLDLSLGDSHNNPKKPHIAMQLLMFTEKVKSTAKSVVDNMEFSAGIGQGIYGEFNLLDIASVGIGVYGNYFSMSYRDGNLTVGQEINAQASISITRWFEFGGGAYSFMQNGKEVSTNSWLGLNSTQESWTLFNFAVYPLFAGISVSVDFDIINFCKDIDDIWR